MEGARAWLAQSKQEDYRRLIGSDRYDDDAASHYSWDSSVPSHATVAEGDAIVIWDNLLLGASVIEHIEHGTKEKRTSRCPECGRANVVMRSTMQPPYRCDDCHAEFDQPEFTTKTVTTYRSNHGQAWVDLEGVLDGPTLRSVCVYPKSQNSFRQLRWDDFRAALRGATQGDPLRVLDVTSEQIAGGHKTRPVRVRIGQAAFRAALLAQYDRTCAITGPCPTDALEACHLYSYAKVGEHKDQGGVLLRRDIHRLFDIGLIAVDGAGVVDVAAELLDYPTYRDLHGTRVHIDLSEKQRAWLRGHWTEWRSAADGG
ncbi:HNH endonuclease [Aldersonia sp. NBC_00410]|uniref:HNH endonuclease n=1 Tax=Aldersonia sp. NBC_00410 TaxID=2975954 RepID=UPI002B1E848B|nr:HNH endonuclease [Aldersonia sp. NBC_00410]